MKKKKILYINQYFKHPSEPGITRSYWIALELIKHGYEVTMLAHRNVQLKHIDDAQPVEIQYVDGIKVIYIRNAYSNDMGVWARVWSFLKFMFKSTRYAIKEKDIDLVIATSTPLTVAFPALLRKLFKNTRYVFEVRDLWPEAPIQMGALKNSLLIWLLRKFEEITYKNAEHVVALSPGMQEGVTKYIDREKTSMIPNMAKIDQFWPREKNVELMESMGLSKESFKAIYFGQMGRSNDIPFIVDAARKVHTNKKENIEFLFIGHGTMWNKANNIKNNEGLTNIHIFERKPMDEISEIVNFCDVALVTFSDIPILKTNSPNKLFDALSAGKPVIVNSNGWTKKMVEKYKCGFYVKSSDELVDVLKTLSYDHQLREEMGKNARNLAENKYDKSILCDQFAKKINKLI